MNDEAHPQRQKTGLADLARAYAPLRVIGFASLTPSKVAFLAFLFGFCVIVLLTWMEGSLGSFRDGSRFTFLGAGADPFNWAVCVPVFTWLAVSFVGSIDGWLQAFLVNMLPMSDEVEAQIGPWLARVSTSFRDSWFWGYWRWRLVPWVLLPFSVWSSWWSYRDVARQPGVRLFGFADGSLAVSPDNLYVALMLGIVSYIVVFCLILAARTVWLFHEAYRDFADKIAANPLHPDGSAGMGFVNDMALRFLALFGLAALMATNLMARDLLGGIGWRFYHIGAAVLWIVGLGLAARGIWDAHRVLMRARTKLREQFSRELDPAKVSPGHLASWAQETSSALDVINAFPVWPTTLASLGAGVGSLLAGAASLLIPVWLQSP